MKKILVLGGNGFIGAHLVQALLTKGYKVRIWDKRRKNPLKIISSAEFIPGNFTDCTYINEVVKDIDVAYHLMSTTIPSTSNQDPVFDIQSNLIGSLDFLKAAIKANIKKIIFISSGGTIYGNTKEFPIRENVIPNPICSYGIVKAAIENYLHLFYNLYGLHYTIFRLANPFGEGQRPGKHGVIPTFMQQILKDKEIEIWGDGSIIRDYIYIKDVIDLLLKSAEVETAQYVFNVGSGIGRSINEIVKVLERVSGKKIKCCYKNIRKEDVKKCILSYDLAKQELDWFPKVTFNEGIVRTWAWFQKNF